MDVTLPTTLAECYIMLMAKSTDKVAAFFSTFPSLRYKKGEIILRPEDIPQGIYYVAKGYVRVYAINENGKELTVYILKKGFFFPVVWAIGGLPNFYFFEAITPVEIRRAPKNKLLAFIKKDPSLLYELTKRVTVGLGEQVVRMEYLLLNEAERKIASTLLLLARRFGKKGENGEIAIRVPMTHKQISTLAGVTRKTTSLEIKKLENEGVLAQTRRFIVIKRVRKLKNIAPVAPREKLSSYTF